MKKKIALLTMLMFLIVLSLPFLFGGTLLRGGVEVGGSAALGTDVTLASASLSILGGSVELTELSVGNLDGYSEPKLLEARVIRMKVAPMSLLSKTVEIEEIVLESPVFTLEATLKGSNLNELLSRFESGEAGSGGEAPPAPTEAAGEQTQLNVGLVLVTAPRVIVSQSAWGKDRDEITLDNIEIRDLGSSDMGGLTEKIVAEVLRQVLTKNHVPADLQAVLSGSGGDLIQPVKKEVDKVKGVLKKQLDGFLGGGN